MIRTETALMRPNSQPRLPPKIPQPKKESSAIADHRHHEITGHDVGQTLHRCFGTLCLGDHLDDLGEHGLGTDLLGANHQAARGVQRRTDHLVAGPLRHGQGFAGQHGFVNRAGTFRDFAIHRHLLAWPHTQDVTDVNVRQRHVLLAAVRPDAPGGLGSEAEQGLDRRRGFRARAQLQHLPEQGQRDDHRCRLEIDTDAAVGFEGGRE